MRPAITSAATSCAGQRSRASASPAVTICTLPERWRGAPAVPDTRGHLRSSAPGHHHGGNFLRGAGTVTRQRVTCRHDLHPAGTLARRSGCAGHQGASAQQCARLSPRRQPPARGGNGHAPARHLPSRSAPCRNAGAALRQGRTPGGICAAVRPAITTAATSCGGRERSRASASPAVTICTLPECWRGAPAVPDTRGHLRSSAPGHHHGGNFLRGAGTVTRQRVTCRHDLHPAGTLARRSGCAGHQGASAQQCARPSPRRQLPARGGNGHAPARHLPSRSAPCRNAGAALRQGRTPGGICAAVRPVITTTAATSCAGRERSCASASPVVTICTLPERWRGAPAGPDTRGHLRSSAPGHHHGGNLLRGAGTVTRQRVTCRHDLHPAGTLARRSGCAGHQGASAQQCARPSPRRQLPARGGNGHAPARHLTSRSAPCRNAGAALRQGRTPGGICAAVRPVITTAATSCAGRERSCASASPVVTICTLPERWRGAPAGPDTRGHLRSSAPGHHHGGNLLRGAGTVTRQRVTCRHDLHPAGTLARRSGRAGHQGASAQQCARSSPRRQPRARGGNGHAPARHLPSRSAPCRNADAALRLCRTPGASAQQCCPVITTVMALRIAIRI
ncbi:hypothetical protein M1V99_00030 (plasmid) [Enterobacter bugandensis]|uniref:hypothetical protein n=2 Tax=Enterobacter TaxID=547 RepID=UPI0020185E19|nr:hypothetical protein [Enterobacter bugandensis]UQQ28789.1 hypothetical protein M1V99_00030 [Enterobacter bugandensis]